MRTDNRACDQMRPVQIERHYTKFAEGSVRVSFGDTILICTATVSGVMPSWLRDTGKGWVTAEYAMLPRSAPERVLRDTAKKGRALEISRIIGRSLRSVVDLQGLGERQVILDCDVIQADGGTRTAAVTGAYVALHDAVSSLAASGKLAKSPMMGQCAAVSVGVVGGEVLLDLRYEEDVRAEVDMNLVMRENGEFIEIQGSSERKTFDRDALDRMIDLGQKGIRELMRIQSESLSLG
ncbi:MAG: ribonuclease PH [Candidatus Hydrogenedentes bacterium]|nr:ribonuclease PH [Candidatus Hydrogenedentota bacterium]